VLQFYLWAEFPQVPNGDPKATHQLTNPAENAAAKAIKASNNLRFLLISSSKCENLKTKPPHKESKKQPHKQF
jgi:hypothetical protein